MKKVVIEKKVEPHPGSYDIRTDLTAQSTLKWKNNQEKGKI